jgi:hypothetical protein
MFHPFTYDERHRTYLAHFSGTLTQQDMLAFDAAALECRDLLGPVHGLIDFSDVESVDVTTAQFVARATRPQIMVGHKRAIVANGLVFGLMRMFGVYQSREGVEPMIVHTLPEAYEALGLVADEFHPVALSTPLVSALPA